MKIILLIAVFGFSFNYAFSQCSSDDCLKSPITDGCVKYCVGLNSIIINASETELKLIGGFDSLMTSKILIKRKNTPNLNLESFYESLQSIEKESFTKTAQTLSKDQTNYFSLSAEERKKIILELEKNSFKNKL